MGRRLEAARRARGWSPATLTRALGVDVEELRRVELGKWHPALVGAMADALGVKRADVARGTAAWLAYRIAHATGEYLW